MEQRSERPVLTGSCSFQLANCWRGSEEKSRDDRIRTCGPFVPNEVRYQAAPHPDFRSVRDRPSRLAETGF